MKQIVRLGPVTNEMEFRISDQFLNFKFAADSESNQEIYVSVLRDEDDYASEVRKLVIFTDGDDVPNLPLGQEYFYLNSIDKDEVDVVSGLDKKSTWHIFEIIGEPLV